MSRPLQAVVLSIGIVAAILALPRGASAGSAIPNLPAGSNSANASSWLAGAHAGYNWQRGTAVFGFETDLSATHLQSAMNGGLSYLVGPPPPGDAASTTGSIGWYGTVRGRLGATAGPVLFYGTAGLAYGNVGLSSRFSGGGLMLNSQTSEVKTGWVAGAGVEYLLNPNLILSVGYQYVDLGTLNLTSSLSSLGPTISQTASAHAQFQAVMAGLSWKFSPAGSMAPWEGGYVGGHAGGAWGNRTNATYTSFQPSPPPPPSDARLKRDVTLLGRRDDGLGIYRFKYLWSDTVYVGVLAQEVALVHPDAVVRDRLSGYLSVDYGRLGLQMVALTE